VQQWCAQQQEQQQLQQPAWEQLTAAYASALSAAQAPTGETTHSSSSSSNNPNGVLQQLLLLGTSLLESQRDLLVTCMQDESLTHAWKAAHSSSSSSRKRFLVAANFHNSAAVLPNFVLQVLQLVLVLPQQSVAVGVYESGSSDTSRWVGGPLGRVVGRV
jgi:hypothetical protein